MEKNKTQNVNKVSLAAVNVNGLRDRTSYHKLKTICRVLKRSKRDLNVLIDTRTDETTAYKLEKHWSGSVITTEPRERANAGIALLSRFTAEKFNNIDRDPEGRYLMTDVTLEEETFLIVAIYAPADNATNRKNFFIKINDKIANRNTTNNMIILGDFNMVESVNDKTGSTTLESSRKTLNDMKTKHLIEDVWRRRNPNRKSYTHSHASGCLSRIDRMYSSRAMRGRIIETGIDPFAHSDHDMVYINIETGKKETGPGVWVMDQSLLQDETFCNSFELFWRDWVLKLGDFHHARAWWDEAKDKIQQLAKKRTKEINNIRDRTIKQTKKNLRRAISKEPKSELVERLRNRLKNLEEQECHKYIAKSRSQWVEEGERCTKYFLNLCKKREGDTYVHSLRKTSKDGKTTSIVTESNEILDVMKSFYEDLYTAEPTSEEAQREMLQDIQKTLTTQQKNLTNGIITKDEIQNAIKGMNNGKSPGSDGIPSEFYKRFWNTIGNDLMQMFDEIHASGCLSDTQSEALIKCLPKKGDLLEMANWRPVSLLNTDYKILAKALANRVIKVLEHIVETDQTCNIPGRNIFQSMSHIRDVINYANENELDAYVLTIDQMKAFDRVDRGFLMKTLRTYGFGEDFTHYVETLYRKTTSKIKANGYTSVAFELTRGVRQGCPLSALLYVLVAETLANAIRKNEQIVGIRIENEEHKLDQYADDTTLFLQGESSADALKETLKIYEKASGAKVHPGKCVGTWLGKNRGLPKNENIAQTWANKQKILGLYFGDVNVKSDVWEKPVDSFKKTLTLWFSRNLSLKGRKIVVNQLAASRLVYPASIYACPSEVETDLQIAISNFMRRGATPWLDHRILQQNVIDGGLGVVNIKLKLQAMRLTWVRKLFNPVNTGKWKSTMEYFLSKYRKYSIGKDIFKLSLQPERTITESKMPQFYKTLCKDWVKLTSGERVAPKERFGFLNEPLFWNKTITKVIDGLVKPLIPATNHLCNLDFNKIRHVKDLCHKDKKGFLTRQELNEKLSTTLSVGSYDRIMSYIPQTWRETISNQEPTEQENYIEIKLPYLTKDKVRDVTKTTTKHIYKVLLGDSATLYMERALDGKHIYSHWQRTLGPINWNKTFTSMYESHANKRATDVQFNLLHGSIANRKRMYLRGYTKAESPQCKRCNTSDETDLHIFAECTHSVQLWWYATLLIRKIYPDFDNHQRYIVVGFHGTIFPERHREICEEIRRAFFAATWKERNKATYQDEIFESLPYLKARLEEAIAWKHRKYATYEGIIFTNTNGRIKLMDPRV